MIEIILYSIPGWIIGAAGLVYMHKFDKPEEVEVIKEVEVIVYKERIIKVPLKTVTKHLVVYRDGKGPTETVYIDRSRQLGMMGGQGARQAAAFNQLGLGAAQHDPYGRGFGTINSLFGNL